MAGWPPPIQIHIHILTRDMSVRKESTVTAVLEGGPLDGRRVDADVVEGRPAKTIDVRADDGTTCRYCLAEWAQSGQSAAYSFLYRV